MIWREKIFKSLLGEWIGPYVEKSFDADSRILLVQKNTEKSLERYSITQVEPFLSPEPTATEFMGNLSRAFIHYISHERPVHMFSTERINLDDPRANSPETRKTIDEEVQDLLKRGTLRKIWRSDLPDNANALTARFVLEIKSNSECETRYKARYFVGGYRDSMKPYIIHGVQSLEPTSARLLLVLAPFTIFKFGQPMSNSHIYNQESRFSVVCS